MVLNLSSLCLLFKFFQNFLVFFFCGWVFVWGFFGVSDHRFIVATKLRIEETLFRNSTFTGHCVSTSDLIPQIRA